MSRDFDFIVIGASVGGLAAAGALVRGSARVLVVERELAPPEPRGPLFALDPAMIADLKLAQHGLSFRLRDLALTGWDDGEPPLTLPPDRRAAARAIAAISETDAEAWGVFQSELQARAHALRRWWAEPRHEGRAADLLWQPDMRAAFARECVSGAADFLARHFESPRLIGTLLQDAVAGGFAASEPGSALALIWRAAQGAPLLAVPGTLMAALRRACGAELQLGTTVTEILVARGQATAVRLDDGEVVSARAILSSLPRGQGEKLAGLERPREDSAVGEARIVFTLGESVALPSALQTGRCVAALLPEDYADAHEAARAGRLAPLPPFAVVAETPRALVVSLPLMPVSPPQGWAALEAPLAARMVKTLSRQVPGLAKALTGVTVTPPKHRPRASLAQLLAPAFTRAITRVPGLYQCGEDAEPVPCVSGRAGRFAAHFVTRTNR